MRIQTRWHREGGHFKIISREREILGNKRLYDPLFMGRFKIFIIWSNLEGFLVGMLPTIASALQLTGIQLPAENRGPGNCRTSLGWDFSNNSV